MSHFSVAVFHRDNQEVEDLLAPYDESISVAPYVEYTREEAIKWVHETLPEWAADKTDDECYNFMADENETDEDGNILSTYNPNAKWDWWTEGGRWSDMLVLKTGEPTNSAKIKDLDLTDGEFAKFGTFAVIKPNGLWYEKGSMGWFGLSTETEEEADKWTNEYKAKFVDTADPEWNLTIVDCHI